MTENAITIAWPDWARLEEESEARQEPSWLRELRRRAFRLLQETPQPNGRDGDLSFLLQAEAPQQVAEQRAAEGDEAAAGAQESLLVEAAAEMPLALVRDGKVSEAGQLVPQIVLAELGEAARQYPDLVRPYLFNSALKPGQPEDETGFYLLLQAALWDWGLFLHLPAGVQAEMPVGVLQQITAAGRRAFRHVLIVLEAGAELDLLEETVGGAAVGAAWHGATAREGDDGQGNRPLLGQSWEVVLKEGAKLRLGLVQNLAAGGCTFRLGRALLEKDATLELFAVEVGGRWSRLQFETELIGQGASVSSFALFLGTGRQRYHLDLGHLHRGEHTRSDMTVRGVLRDRAYTRFRGLGYIHFGAQGASSFQRTDTLLLSRTARADVVPSLKIDEDDVQAGHGAAVGQVDEEALFYLMSRGLSRVQATRLIVEGFLQSLLDKATVPGVDRVVRLAALKKIESQA
ncbi:MAG: SufD family Fe-S cluster assembly protein [Limnochordales bacterium]|nr:SufD family Fe-S cluster assembly protein [Limnochordales bacterium]